MNILLCGAGYIVLRREIERFGPPQVEQVVEGGGEGRVRQKRRPVL